ncbi:vacuolar assembling protein VPS41 [Amanita rubescens]|nr:vacuolar assembling protein VPS41 [Amanita rubescens]
MSLSETLASNHDDAGPLKMQSVDAREHENSDVIKKSVNGHVASEPEAELEPDGGREDAVKKDKDEGESGPGIGEDDEEEEEEEPSLKYERIAGAIPDLLKKDAASSLAIMNRTMALGTHGGIVHILDLSGKRLKSYKPHMASIVDISVDATGDFVATASIDGQVVIHSLSTPESYVFDMKRPMRSVAMEPNFGKRGARAFVCGGLSGKLVLRERGWIGHKETVLHSGDGPIWQVRWRSKFIAWADDYGVKIYDTQSQGRFATIDRASDSPRADLFKCSLYWQDDSTLLIGWADTIKVARIRARQRSSSTVNPAVAKVYPYAVEITAHLKLDAMISGLVTHPLPNHGNGNHKADISNHAPLVPSSPLSSPAQARAQAQARALTGFLIIAYNPPERFDDEMTEDRAKQARKSAERPEMRIVSRAGEELVSDALGVINFHAWGCNDYTLVEVDSGTGTVLGTGTAIGHGDAGRCYVALSPKDLVLVMPRDRRDHISWLMEKKRYEEALEEAEALEAELVGATAATKTNGMHSEKEAEKPDIVAKDDLEDRDPLSSSEIGQRYIEYLVDQEEYDKAAELCPKVCGHSVKRWESWIFTFAERRQLQAIIPYTPIESPTLDRVVYDMIMAHFLAHDHQALLQTIKEWPKDAYDISAVIVAVRSELEKLSMFSSTLTSSSSKSPTKLMECLAELYTINRQPGKALPYYLRLRRPNVFNLIREHSLFTDVSDQVLLLVEFDDELMTKRKEEGAVVDPSKSEGIALLVDNIHAIPITRVVQQLTKKPYYLFLYLDALFIQDPHLVAEFADMQVKLYAEYALPRLIDFLRASNYYSLEQAFEVCKERDLVPEMVFLLGKMGNNKQALTLIIERLGDVQRAIEFAKEQNDDDLWEDLLRYSETRPTFIRGLLENVGVEISPIRLIRRIKNGLEIPGLKDALIKILQDFHLQISLLQGCQTILYGDSAELSHKLQNGQTGGFFLTAKTTCSVCLRSIQETPDSLVILYLCRHVVHATCLSGSDRLPPRPDPVLRSAGLLGSAREINGKIAYESIIRARIGRGCPVCHGRADETRT